MKFRTTKKEMQANYTCIAVGYCGLQNLLKFESPVAYTSGRDGWRADVYVVGSKAIVTGYAPFGKSVSYESTRKYEALAEKAHTKSECDELVHAFLQEVLG